MSSSNFRGLENFINGGHMKRIGRFLLIFGIGSVVLYFLNMQFIILAWVDMWGPEVGWAIKVGMIVVGAVLWFLGNKQETVKTTA